MPKLIVLFDGRDEAARMLAKNAADGAAQVRFTEVDVRSIGGTDGARGDKTLESASHVGGYDGVLLAVAKSEIPPELAAAVGELASGGQLPNMVLGVTGTGAAALEQLARIGGIIVSEPAGTDPEERARKLAARMAKVIGWVRHALSHEAEHHHHH